MGVWTKFAALFGAGAPGLVPDADSPLDPTKFLSQNGWAVPSAPVPGVPDFIGARILLVNPLTVPTDTPTSFQGVTDFDFTGFTGGGASETTFTIPVITGVDEGVFLVSGVVFATDSSTLGGLTIRVVVTGASAGNYGRVEVPINTDVDPAGQGLSTTILIRMAPGDTAKLQITQTSGGDAAITVGEFSISLLGKVPA